MEELTLPVPSAVIDPSAIVPTASREEIVITHLLVQRPTRVADYATENRVMNELLRVLAAEHEDVLQRLVDETMEACRAHTAGISLLEHGEQEAELLWRAVAGQWKPFVGARHLRSSGPSGAVLDSDAAMLMAAPQRHYAFPSYLHPAIHEILLVPIHVGKVAVGSLWVIAHDESRKFDLEDVRLLKSLANFAATAHQLLTTQQSEREAAERLLIKTSELNRLAETSAIGLTWCGRDYRYKLVNRAYAQIMGFTQQQIIGRELREVVGDSAWEVIRPNVDRVLRGETVEYEAEVTLRGGPRCIHVKYMPDINESGEIAGWIASVMDVTERRASEQALERSAQQKDALYQLVDQLHRTSSLSDVFAAALDAIIAAIQCDRASILLFDESGVMRFVGWLGLSDAYRKATEGHSPWTVDVTAPQPISVDDVASEPLDDWLKSIIIAEGLGALAFIPLVANGRLIGKFMTYYNQPHAFSADELELALTIARQLAFAIDRHRAQQLLRDHADQLALITDTAPVYIAHCDTQSRLKFVNRAYADRLGLTPEECVGKLIAEVIGPRGYEQIRGYIDQVLGGIPADFEVTIPYPQLGDRYMHCSYAPQFDTNGSVIAFVAAITDITDRRRVEDALRDSEDKLRQADRRKDEFLAMLAHELRNPLAPIANAIHLLNREQPNDAVHRQARAIIERQTGRLARLVDDLLEVSRINTGRIQLHMERLAISGIVERAIETARPVIEQHRHALRTTLPRDPVWVHADATRMEQVVVNLLNNAAKYTQDGGRIEIAVHVEDSKAVLRVTDNGSGIDAEILPRVFDLFTQAERTLDRSRGGLGIGLSLVQRLVNMHGGEVSAKSEPGLGSEFTVRLPIIDAQSNEAAPVNMIRDEASTSIRVLIVDDNVDAAQSLAMVLEVEGHAVTVAHAGGAALQKVRECQPQVMLLDIGLPEIDGYEVARRIRSDPTIVQPILIAMTGYGQQSDKDMSRAAGFDHHLVKPADIADIEAILDEVSARATPSRK
ncbi:MAG: PAS domain-containing protein [Povalibacter sp.]